MRPVGRLPRRHDSQDATQPAVQWCGSYLLLLLLLLAADLLTGAKVAAADRPAPPQELQRLIANVDAGAELRSWKYIVLHHSAAAAGSVASIDADHRQRLDDDGLPWRGIGYHFVIGNGDGMGDGEIAATFRWREQCDGAHAGVSTFNQFGIGVCLIGDFDAGPPTPAQLQALERLIAALRQEYGIEETELLAHRDLKPTACPGGQFPLARLRAGQKAILRTSTGED